MSCKFNYDILLFDADDTLFDFTLSEKTALKLTLDEFCLPFNDDIHSLYHQINADLWKACEGRNAHDRALISTRFDILLQKLNLLADSTALNNRYVENLSRQSFLIDDAYSVCSKLFDSHDMYIITNGTPSVSHSRFDPSPIRPLFKDMFISWEIGFSKPDIKYFDTVFLNIDIKDLSRVLVIGDSPYTDIQGGINAGVDTCWFNRKSLPRTDIKPKYEIHSLTELFSIV